MKKAQADLVQLIRSMSKAEKRSFRLQHQRGENENKNYIRIYDAIVSSDSAAVLIDASDDDQEYLFGLLIDLLTQQQKRSSLEIEFRAQLSSVSVMARRGLEKKAFRLLDKLLAQAYQSGLYEFGLDVIGEHMRLLTTFDKSQALKQLIAERKKLLALLHEFQRYDEWLIEAYSFLHQEDKAGALRLYRKISRIKAPTDTRNLVHRHHLLAHLSVPGNQLEEMELHHRTSQLLFEKNPLFLKARVVHYIMMVLNSGILAWHRRDSERLLESIAQLQQIPKITGALQVSDQLRADRYSLDLMLRSNLLAKTPEKNLALASRVLQLIRTDPEIEPFRINYLHYFMALSHYETGRSREAIQWVQPVIDSDKKGYYNNKTYSIAWLLRAACHLELGNDIQADALLLAFRRNKTFRESRKAAQFIRLQQQIRQHCRGELWFL